MMATASKRGNPRGDGRGVYIALLSAALAVAVAGCSGTSQGHLAGDPLFGEFGLKQPGPSAPPTPPSSKSQAGVPPIPSAQFSSSPAALAAGPLPGARPLAIDGSGRATNNILPASGSAAPRPTVLPVPRETTPHGPAVVPAGGTASWGPQSDAILEQFEARGVLFQKLETLADGVRLSVIVRTDQADTTRVLTATGSDFNSAAQAILRKLGR